MRGRAFSILAFGGVGGDYFRKIEMRGAAFASFFFWRQAQDCREPGVGSASHGDGDVGY